MCLLCHAPIKIKNKMKTTQAHIQSYVLMHAYSCRYAHTYIVSSELFKQKAQLLVATAYGYAR